MTVSVPRRIAGFALLVGVVAFPVQILGGLGRLPRRAAGAADPAGSGAGPLRGVAVGASRSHAGDGVRQRRTRRATSSRAQLADPADLLAFAGSVVPMIGLVVALVFGTTAVLRR
jgi:hypothetical protein